jgi:hypothetical protein
VYENPSLDITIIELFSTRVCTLEEAREHCFQIQSAISVVILISIQCYCGECSGYIVVILPLLAFYFSSTYILYLVYYSFLVSRDIFSCITIHQIWKPGFPSTIYTGKIQCGETN